MLDVEVIAFDQSRGRRWFARRRVGRYAVLELLNNTVGYGVNRLAPCVVTFIIGDVSSCWPCGPLVGRGIVGPDPEVVGEQLRSAAGRAVCGAESGPILALLQIIGPGREGITTPGRRTLILRERHVHRRRIAELVGIESLVRIHAIAGQSELDSAGSRNR